MKYFNVKALFITAAIAWLPSLNSALAESPSQDRHIDLIQVPRNFKYDENTVYLQSSNGPEKTNLVPELQHRLRKFIRDRGNPIAAVVIAEVSTGNIIAMVDGQAPEKWGAEHHTALHAYFPAASLFKTVVASAGIELAGLQPRKQIGLIGGCGKVRATGGWMTREVRRSKYDMNLLRAYGHSCNGFFAKLAINHIGMGPILDFAHRFRWGAQIPADFAIPHSPMTPPSAMRSSVHTVGRFAAGFGYVGTSVMHSIWRNLVIANGGESKALKILASSAHDDDFNLNEKRIMSLHTADELKKLMVATVKGGTASSAFRKYPYRKFREDMGGKTGTLTGSSPEGLTTWFAGIYPLKNPEIVVSAVTILEDLWIFKAPNLAAEAIYQWSRIKKSQNIATIQKKKEQVRN